MANYNTYPIPVCLMLTCVSTTTPTITPVKLSTTYNGNNLYSVTFSVSAKTHYSNTLSTLTYNGTNISLGNWIAGGTGGGCWKIYEITTVSAGQVTVTLEDVNNYTLHMNNTNSTITNIFKTGTGSNNYIYFTLGSDGQPILTPMFGSSFPTTTNYMYLLQDIMSRFSYLNPSRQYINLFQTNFSLPIGTPIWLNPSTNKFESSLNTLGAPYTIGIVTSIGVTGAGASSTVGNFTIKTYGTYYNDTSSFFPTTQLSSLITSSQIGSFLYIDTNSNPNSNGYTIVKPQTNAVPIWLYLGKEQISKKDTGILFPCYGSNSGSSGSAAITSTATSTLDPWLNANFIAQPPAPTLITTTSLPNDIYVVVNPPPQTTLPILSTPVPVINYVSAGILNNSSSLTTTQLQFPTTSVLTTPLLTKENASSLSTSSLCIHLSTITPITTATMYALTSSQSIPMKNYSITSSQLSSSQLYVWYSNNAMGSYPYNVLSVPISYLLAGYPGAFSITSFSSSTNPSTNPSLLVILNPPLADSANNINASTSPLTYKITYTKNNVNSVRQGGAFGSAATYNYSYPANNSVNTTTLSLVNSTNNPIYPDTQYTITGFSATNESNNLTTATLSSTQIITTPGFDLGGASASQYLTGNANNNNTLTNQTLVQGKSVANSGVVSLLASRDATFQTPNMAFNIQNAYATRGLLASSTTTLVTIVSQLNQDNVANAIGGTSTTIVFNGGIALTTTVTNTNSTMTATVNDQYTNTTPQFQGYYQYANVVTSITTPSALFTAASNKGYSLNVVGTYELINTNDRNMITSTYNSNKFYYDGYNGTNNITTATLTATISAATTAQLCGITVITNTGLQLNTLCSGISGIGTYFYNASQIMAYNLNFGTNNLTAPAETTLVGSNLSGTGTQIANNVNFERQNLSVTFNGNSYASSLTVNTTIYDAYGNTKSALSTPITLSVIYDPSVTTLLTSIQAINTTVNPVNGCRLYSGTTSTLGQEMSKPNNSATILKNNGAFFSTSLYDNSQLINNQTYLNELLYSNGYFQTKDANPNSSLGYINYSSYYGNNSQLNYSNPNSLNGYRYCTFAWKIDSTIPSFTYATFTLNNTSGLTLNANNTVVANNLPIYLFYRLEDQNASTITIYNTPWINGNNYTDLTEYNSSNYSNSNYSFTGIGNTSISSNANQFSFKGKFAQPLNGNGNNQYLYCRVGLPMDSPCYFSNISVSLSQN